MGGGDADMGEEGGADQPPAKRLHTSRGRSVSRGAAALNAPLEPGSGFKDKTTRAKAAAMADKQQKVRNKEARKGEGDRVFLQSRPKHLFSGKRGNGKTDRR